MGSLYFDISRMVKETYFRWRVTPIWGHVCKIGQEPQKGETGLHRFCPNETNKSLKPFQYRFGRISRNTISVSSGDFVFTYPKRLQIRWTWISTQMPGLLCPNVKVRFAVFRPTPLSLSNSSNLSGTFPEYSFTRTLHISFIDLALFRKNAAG